MRPGGWTLELLPARFAVCRLPADAPPPGRLEGSLVSVTRTADELSLVVEERLAPPGATTEPGWRALKVRGPLDFGLVGVLAALTRPLAAAGVSVFALSTYDTDYLLVRDADLPRAALALRAAGHTIAGAG